MTWDKHCARGATIGAFVGLAFYAFILWLGDVKLPGERGSGAVVLFLGAIFIPVIAAFIGASVADLTYKGEPK